MVYRDDINRLHKNLSERKEVLAKELQTLPDGEFYACVSGGIQHYYRRFRKTGNRKKERRVGVSKKPELLNALVRKKYVVNALSILEKDIAAAEELLRVYVPSDENSVMHDFISRYPDLVGGVYQGVWDPDEWSGARGGQSEFHIEGLTSIASDGTKRRSKGEILIGSKLSQYGIPYLYEAAAHPDLPWVPDFKIRRPRDGKIIFWEHFGRVNDSEYMEHCRIKLADYEKADIVPWDNLIITYDQADGGINEKLIDAMVHGWFL